MKKRKSGADVKKYRKPVLKKYKALKKLTATRLGIFAI